MDTCPLGIYFGFVLFLQTLTVMEKYITSVEVFLGKGQEEVSGFTTISVI